MKYRFIYKETKHVINIIDWMEDNDIDENNVTQEEYEWMVKNINGAKQHFQRIEEK